MFSQDNLTPSLADQLKDMMKTKVGEYKISGTGHVEFAYGNSELYST